jgi:hypothetical protein
VLDAVVICVINVFVLPPKTPTQKLWIAAGVLVVAGLLFYVYRDAFRAREILITHRVVTGPPIRGLSRTNQDLKITQVAFGLDRKYALTEIKVISLTSLEAGTNAMPLWHVISDSNSIPVKAFAYGDHIRGLRPLVKQGCALALEPNVNYRLVVRAGRQTGQHDFSVTQVITVSR